jgi:hypothetical protein
LISTEEPVVDAADGVVRRSVRVDAGWLDRLRPLTDACLAPGVGARECRSADASWLADLMARG